MQPKREDDKGDDEGGKKKGETKAKAKIRKIDEQRPKETTTGLYVTQGDVTARRAVAGR